MKIRTYVLISSFTTQKGTSKKLQALRKGPYQINDKATDVTHKLTDSNKKETVQHRNNLLPYYPKEYALCEISQLYSLTGLKVIQNSGYKQNQITDTISTQKLLEQKIKTRNLLNKRLKI